MEERRELSVQSFVVMIVKKYLSSCKKKVQECKEVLKLGNNHLVGFKKQ